MTIRRRPLGIALLLAIGAPPTALSGQLCVHPRPAPACSSFLIVQAGYGVGLVGGGTHLVNVELGWMHATSARSALGASVFLGDVADIGFYSRAALKVRYRRWLGARTSLDIAPGIGFFTPLWGAASRRPIGGTAEVSLAYEDTYVLFNHWEIYDRGAGAPHGPGSWFTGIRLGSKTAIYAVTITGALLGVMAAALHR